MMGKITMIVVLLLCLQGAVKLVDMFKNSSVISMAKVTKASVDLKQIVVSLEFERELATRYPIDVKTPNWDAYGRARGVQNQLVAFIEKNMKKRGGGGNPSMDPWENFYAYFYNRDNNYFVYSNGEDGVDDFFLPLDGSVDVPEDRIGDNIYVMQEINR